MFLSTIPYKFFSHEDIYFNITVYPQVPLLYSLYLFAVLFLSLAWHSICVQTNPPKCLVKKHIHISFVANYVTPHLSSLIFKFHLVKLTRGCLYLAGGYG